MNLKQTSLAFLKRHGVLLVGAGAGLSILRDSADAISILRVIGIVCALLLVTSLALDDRHGFGIFPAYDEGELIEKASQSPVAAASIVIVKNLVMLAVIALGLLFCMPR